MMDPGALAGRHAFVTGASGGIGAAVASTLAGHGANVTLGGRDRTKLQRASAEIKSTHLASVDVADPQSVAAAFAGARDRFGPVDILVNAAGAASSAPFSRVALHDWKHALDVNLTAVFLCCREAVGPMIERGFGRIINIASTAGLTGYRYVAAYCAAKHGVVGLTKSIALETAQHGITVNAICPGFVETEMLQRTVSHIVSATGRSDDAARKALLSHTPRGTFVTPNEVAQAVVWLCLPGSEGVTGQAIAIDGGELAG